MNNLMNLQKIKPATNYILNVIKSKYKLKDKSTSINFVVTQYGAEMLESEL
jgi:hypothetical protein